jgi:hypothetical protein
MGPAQVQWRLGVAKLRFGCYSVNSTAAEGWVSQHALCSPAVAVYHIFQFRLPPHMALAYQLSGMGISGQARPSNNAMPGMMQVMPHGYAPAASPAAPMAVIGTDSKTIKIRGLPFRCVRW